jgi:hypothetical protein
MELRPHEGLVRNDDDRPDTPPDAELPTDNVTEDYDINKKTIELEGEILEPKGPA